MNEGYFIGLLNQEGEGDLEEYFGFSPQESVSCQMRDVREEYLNSCSILNGDDITTEYVNVFVFENEVPSLEADLLHIGSKNREHWPQDVCEVELKDNVSTDKEYLNEDEITNLNEEKPDKLCNERVKCDGERKSRNKRCKKSKEFVKDRESTNLLLKGKNEFYPPSSINGRGGRFTSYQKDMVVELRRKKIEQLHKSRDYNNPFRTELSKDGDIILGINFKKSVKELKKLKKNYEHDVERYKTKRGIRPRYHDDMLEIVNSKIKRWSSGGNNKSQQTKKYLKSKRENEVKKESKNVPKNKYLVSQQDKQMNTMEFEAGSGKVISFKPSRITSVANPAKFNKISGCLVVPGESIDSEQHIGVTNITKLRGNNDFMIDNEKSRQSGFFDVDSVPNAHLNSNENDFCQVSIDPIDCFHPGKVLAAKNNKNSASIDKKSSNSKNVDTVHVQKFDKSISEPITDKITSSWEFVTKRLSKQFESKSLQSWLDSNNKKTSKSKYPNTVNELKTVGMSSGGLDTKSRTKKFKPKSRKDNSSKYDANADLPSASNSYAKDALKIQDSPRNAELCRNTDHSRSSMMEEVHSNCSVHSADHSQGNMVNELNHCSEHEQKSALDIIEKSCEKCSHSTYFSNCQCTVPVANKQSKNLSFVKFSEPGIVRYLGEIDNQVPAAHVAEKNAQSCHTKLQHHLNTCWTDAANVEFSLKSQKSDLKSGISMKDLDAGKSINGISDPSSKEFSQTDSVNSLELDDDMIFSASVEKKHTYHLMNNDGKAGSNINSDQPSESCARSMSYDDLVNLKFVKHETTRKLGKKPPGSGFWVIEPGISGSQATIRENIKKWLLGHQKKQQVMQEGRITYDDSESEDGISKLILGVRNETMGVADWLILQDEKIKAVSAAKKKESEVNGGWNKSLDVVTVKQENPEALMKQYISAQNDTPKYSSDSFGKAVEVSESTDCMDVDINPISPIYPFAKSSRSNGDGNHDSTECDHQNEEPFEIIESPQNEVFNTDDKNVSNNSEFRIDYTWINEQNARVDQLMSELENDPVKKTTEKSAIESNHLIKDCSVVLTDIFNQEKPANFVVKKSEKCNDVLNKINSNKSQPTMNNEVVEENVIQPLPESKSVNRKIIAKLDDIRNLGRSLEKESFEESASIITDPFHWLVSQNALIDKLMDANQSSSHTIDHGKFESKEMGHFKNVSSGWLKSQNERIDKLLKALGTGNEIELDDVILEYDKIPKEAQKNSSRESSKILMAREVKNYTENNDTNALEWLNQQNNYIDQLLDAVLYKKDEIICENFNDDDKEISGSFNNETESDKNDPSKLPGESSIVPYSNQANTPSKINSNCPLLSNTSVHVNKKKMPRDQSICAAVKKIESMEQMFNDLTTSHTSDWERKQETKVLKLLNKKENEKLKTIRKKNETKIIETGKEDSGYTEVNIPAKQEPNLYFNSNKCASTFDLMSENSKHYDCALSYTEMLKGAIKAADSIAQHSECSRQQNLDWVSEKNEPSSVRPADTPQVKDSIRNYTLFYNPSQDVAIPDLVSSSKDKLNVQEKDDNCCYSIDVNTGQQSESVEGITSFKPSICSVQDSHENMLRMSKNLSPSVSQSKTKSNIFKNIKTDHVMFSSTISEDDKSMGNILISSGGENPAVCSPASDQSEITQPEKRILKMATLTNRGEPKLKLTELINGGKYAKNAETVNKNLEKLLTPTRWSSRKRKAVKYTGFLCETDSYGSQVKKAMRKSVEQIDRDQKEKVPITSDSSNMNKNVHCSDENVTKGFFIMSSTDHDCARCKVYIKLLNDE